ncbi:hypothetical protein SDC9_94671 [bioreactor metagenome]|uniref:Uncharacterized protein n=1 Tax=bioreactor metagenome TaxID=1076179 RepID=A0A645A429_9ZZZZ
MNLNTTLIRSFREKVNSHSSYVYNKYRDIDNKNHWNLICSCMDWITVSVKFLTTEINYDKDIDVRVMGLFSVISAIDIIVESINQLHRVLCNTQDIPFTGENGIFLNNQLALSDNEYFKELRAMFGAHPVNLKHKNGKHWFASWPHEPFSSQNNIFEVRLYSSQVGVKDLSFSVNLFELEVFAIKHYNHLHFLMNEIDKQIEDFCERYKRIKIEKKSDPLELLLVLRKESQMRFNNDYYNGSVDELIILFSTTLDIKELMEEEKKYRSRLLEVIEEILNNLQSMKVVDLVTDDILNPEFPGGVIGYSISKLYDYGFDSRKEPQYDFHMEELDRFSNNIYRFASSRTKEEVILKMKMMLYRYNIEGFS